jgi:hypothetical protein
MESLLFIIPIVISIGNCVSHCRYTYITNRRLGNLENSIQPLQYPQPHSYQSIPPPPSAPSETYTHPPPGYGYTQ